MLRLSLITLLAIPVLSSSTSAADLLLRYTFDEASGGTVAAADSGAVPLAPGTFVGAAGRTTNTPGGVSSGALDLTGSSSGSLGYVTAGDADKLDARAQFTLTTWLNLQRNDSGNHRLLSKQSGGAFDSFNWSLGAPSGVGQTRSADNFNVRLFIGGSNGFQFGATDVNLGAANKWIFLAVTYDGTSSSNNTIFYRGDVDASVAPLGSVITINAGTPLATSAAFNIGHTDGAATSNTAPPGFLDDARVYSGILSAAELEAVRLGNVPEPGTALSVAVLAFLASQRRRSDRDRI